MRYGPQLIAAGYTPHGKPRNGACQCWISDRAPDINVDDASGMWATEDADDSRGFGMTAATLADYLATS